MLNIAVEGVKSAVAGLGSHIYIYTRKHKMTTLVANTLGFFGGGFAKWLKTLTVKVQAAQVRRATINELSSLDNKDLADIGLSRGDIRYLADQHYNDVVNANLKGWV